MKPRVVFCSRVSSAKQADNTSHETQIAAARAWCITNNADLVRAYQETESGEFYLARAELQKALTDLENNDADILLLYDFTRFSRKRKFQEAIKERVQHAGKKLAFCHFTLDYGADGHQTPESELATNIQGDFAVYELAQIRRRMIGGQRRRVAEGRQIANRSPLGLHVNIKADFHAGRCEKDDIGLYRIVESEAPIIRRIFEDYLHGSLTSLAASLNAEGLTTSAGAAWTVDSVRNILRNPAYKGMATYGRTRVITDESRLAEGKGKTYRVKRAPSEITYLPCPAIVTPELWEQCNARLLIARGALGGRRDRLFTLSGLLRCPTCGEKMRGKTQTDNVPYRYYICRSGSGNGAARQSRRGTPFCTQKALPAEVTERAVFDALYLAIEDPNLFVDILAEQDAQPEAEDFTAQIGAVEARERAIAGAQIDAILAGRETVAYDDMLRDLARERGVLLEKQRAALAQRRKRTAAPGRAEALRAALGDLRENLESPDVSAAEKHDLLAGFVEKIQLREAAPPEITFL